MRRRSERKKSTDVVSPAPAAVAAATSRRIGRRSRRSPSLSETEKNADGSESQSEEQLNNRASSEEHADSTRRSRGNRNRTPVKECTTPAKRKNKREPSPGAKIDVIPEEENGSTERSQADGEVCASIESGNDKEVDDMKITTSAEDVHVAESPSPTESKDYCKHVNVLEQLAEVKEKGNEKPDVCETAEHLPIDNEVQEHKSDVISMVPEPNEEAELERNQNNITQASKNDINEIVNNPHEMPAGKEKQFELRKHDGRKVDNGRTRKRRWLTKKCTESKAPILAISTDSLKNLIADVHPVPLSDVQLDSSSEVEEVVSEREEGEETPSPERERRNASIDKVDKSLKRSQSKTTVSAASDHQCVVVPAPVHRSPSPAANQASNVLYITNLVRPFTVLQLKGLLARTGKIIDNGFWIDRIKSKCYVQYESDDEAIETRHALHGVRWPVSNPKCLNVEFGGKADMERAIQSTKDEAPKFGHDNSKDNLIIGSGWNRDRPDIDVKKISRPVREWDVGKKESLDRDKYRDMEKRRSRERETSESRENQRNEKDRRNHRSRGREPRSSSLSPVRKLKKKENDPPLRLLDDLFRKTKATPCIYWLPLTPEQIAEKEAFRQKRIEEHKERIKQKELERVKEREKERGRGNDRDKDKESRRGRSSDRRRSRSRDRRRY